MSKRKQPDPIDVPFEQEFADYYESVVLNLASRWCFYDDEPQFWTERDVFRVGSLRISQQPVKSMGKGHYRFVLIVERQVGVLLYPISSSLYVRCQDQITSSRIHERLLASYDKVLSMTNDHWFSECDGSFEQVSGIQSMEHTDSRIQLKCELRFERQMNHSWSPFYLQSTDELPWQENGDLKSDDDIRWFSVDGRRQPDCFRHCVVPALRAFSPSQLEKY